MENQDYYQILGVAKEATQEEIKSAFKKAAIANHPDKFQDEAEKKQAEDRFKKINESYQTLSDENKRSVYDAGGSPEDLDGFGFNPHGPGGFATMINEFFNNPRRSQQQHQTVVQTQISLVETLKPIDKDISIQLQIPCTACTATGASKTKECEICHGQGKAHVRQGNTVFIHTCNSCGGLGKIVVEKCTVCNGNRAIIQNANIRLSTPAGVEHGALFKAQAVVQETGRVFSDLILRILVEPDEYYEREGSNLKTSISISYPQAILGDTVSMTYLDGSPLKVKIPSSVCNETVIKLKGKGLPVFGQQNETGDLFVVIEVNIPKLDVLNEKQKSLIEQLKKEFEENK